MHHPPEWLNDAELNGFGDRGASYAYLAERCHLILCGHVHGYLQPSSRMHNRAHLFKGGASYSGGNYRNNFSLLRIDSTKRTVERYGFEYDPRTQQWRGEKFTPVSLSIGSEKVSPLPVVDSFVEDIKSTIKKGRFP